MNEPGFVTASNSLGSVYVVENVLNGTCKIGCSINAETRTRCIQTQSGIPSGRIYISDPVSNYMECEKIVHKEIISQRSCFEWFYCNFEDAVDLVKRIVSSHGESVITNKKVKIDIFCEIDASSFFFSDSPEILDWMNKNGYNFYIDDCGIPFVYWFEDGERYDMSFDLFARITIEESKRNN